MGIWNISCWEIKNTKVSLKNLQSYFTLLNDDYLNLKGVKMFKDKAFLKTY